MEHNRNLISELERDLSNVTSPDYRFWVRNLINVCGSHREVFYCIDAIEDEYHKRQLHAELERQSSLMGGLYARLSLYLNDGDRKIFWFIYVIPSIYFISAVTLNGGFYGFCNSSAEFICKAELALIGWGGVVSAIMPLVLSAWLIGEIVGRIKRKT